MSKPKDIEILKKAEVYRGYFRIDRYLLKHELFAGGMSKPVSREVFERGHAVGLLPYDPVRDSVVLLEQFRAGAYAAGMEPWLTEIVAGIIEPGETPEDVAKREALEEAGLTVSALWPVIRYIASPGGASETCRVFIGRIDANGVGGIHGLNSEDEDIRVRVYPWADAVRLLEDGGIVNALGIIALQWFALHRDEVRAQWK
jgi:ADP-ribose pyrophosphatase